MCLIGVPGTSIGDVERQKLLQLEVTERQGKEGEIQSISLIEDRRIKNRIKGPCLEWTTEIVFLSWTN